MQQCVISTSAGHRLEGGGGDVDLVNRFLSHLGSRAFSPATVRAYAYDLLNFLRFLGQRSARFQDVVATDLFDYPDWQQRSAPDAGKVVRLTDRRGAAPATMNRRIAAVRGLFEFAVITGVRGDNPVPAARRSSGLRAKPGGLLGHIGAGKSRTGGRLVRQPRRLPESLEPDDVAIFLTDLRTRRDRSIVLLMLLGGLRAAEVRTLRLADVDMGLRRVRVTGKGGKERVVPVDRAFFAELAGYLRDERPADCTVPQCFVVLRGPTAGRSLTEAGLRRIFRSHRETSGAIRVRPHRLRHTYGTALTRRDRPAGPARPDGSRQSGDHGRVCALGPRDARGRVRAGQGGAAVSAAAVVTLQRQGAPDLLVAYAHAVARLPISPGAKRPGRNAAQRLLAFPCGLTDWMSRPTPARLADLRRTEG
jgi:site-specific recombinase XerD